MISKPPEKKEYVKPEMKTEEINGAYSYGAYGITSPTQISPPNPQSLIGRCCRFTAREGR